MRVGIGLRGAVSNHFFLNLSCGRLRIPTDEHPLSE